MSRVYDPTEAGGRPRPADHSACPPDAGAGSTTPDAAGDPLAIGQAAADWHTRREQGLEPAEEAAFQAWLTADVAHARAWDRLDSRLATLRRLPAAHTAHLRTAPPDFALCSPGAARRSWWTLGGARRAIACVVLLAVAGGGIVWHQASQPVFSQDYVVARGERLEVSLPDASHLTLDADTRIGVALYRDRRTVRLRQGQAMFRVAHDPDRPFGIEAGAARITVIGTRFAVRHPPEGKDAGVVSVAVESGRVRVSRLADAGQAGAGRPSVDLSTGQGVDVSRTGQFGPVANVSSTSIAPWRQGQVRFTSTPLAEAVREFERYAPLGLVIQDPEVAELPIGGSFSVRHPERFIRVLPQVLPVRLQPRADGTTEVVRAY